ncbi:Glycogen synthase 1 [Planctomycetes bacterium Pla163]|uniref:Glycogen synthase n=1 Tax=Rohdeia mirabilis TaxID=2528008 RepID=A0A518CWQ4_9BACT|nr:Glycogen synthase 1 [Planctomycetes bacterium Pla163]
MVKVAFVTPELQQLVRRTNLASVAQDLARHLRAAGSDTRVFIPWTVELDAEALGELEELPPVTVPDPEEPQTFRIHRGQLGDLPVYLFDHPRFFEGKHPYGDENGPYTDNWRRYACFSRAVLASFPGLGFAPDVIHAMDWTGGILPLIHRLEYLEKPTDHPACRAGTFLSVHNLAMQGTFEREILAKMDIPHEYFRAIEGVELAGKVNFLKAGAEFATVVGTHSPHHAKVIQEKDRGYGLEETFERRKKELIGILNGIDFQAWNPKRDPLLPSQFDASDPKGKSDCKIALQSALQLDVDSDSLLACHIGRWDADSGFDLLAEVMGPLLERDVQIVVMGAGGDDVAKRLRTMETTFVGRMRVLQGYDAAAAHRLMGGSDALLLPSHYQPSNPLFGIALRYGVTPIVYANSGLEHVVPDALENPEEGLGFHFSPYTGEGLLEAALRAAEHYTAPRKWRALVMRCLAQDLSWERAADEYIKAYRRVTRRIRGR